MFRTIRVIMPMVFFLLCSVPRLRTVKRLKAQGHYEEADYIVSCALKRFTDILVNNSGAELRILGRENIPVDKAVVFVSNHQSNFDIPIIFKALDMPVAFVSKYEMLKVPIIRTWMKHLKCVFIKRNDMRQSLKVIGEASENVKKGTSVVIFPEGTRSKDGKVAEFKPGGLRIAQKAKCTIVPVTVDGAADLSENNRFGRIKPAKVTVTISKPVEIEGIDKKEEKELDRRIREIIVNNLKNKM